MGSVLVSANPGSRIIGRRVVELHRDSAAASANGIFDFDWPHPQARKKNAPAGSQHSFTAALVGLGSLRYHSDSRAPSYGTSSISSEIRSWDHRPQHRARHQNMRASRKWTDL